MKLSKTWLEIKLRKQDLDSGRKGPAPSARTAGLSGLRWRRLPEGTPEVACETGGLFSKADSDYRSTHCKQGWNPELQPV